MKNYTKSELAKIKKYRKLSFGNKKEILKSTLAGCYSCVSLIDCGLITEFAACNTAICPECGIDSLIPWTDFDITQDLLELLNDYSFNWSRDGNASWYYKGKLVK